MNTVGALLLTRVEITHILLEVSLDKNNTEVSPIAATEEMLEETLALVKLMESVQAIIMSVRGKTVLWEIKPMSFRTRARMFARREEEVVITNDRVVI